MADAMKAFTALLALTFFASAGAQTTSPPPVTPAAAKARSSATPTSRSKTPGAKAVLPDPDILDGSKYEAEKRPLYGMISEIEMGEEEGDNQERVSPNSGPQGAPSPDGTKPAGGGSKPEKEGGSAEKIAEGPQAKPEGAQAQKLNVPEGAQAGGPQGPQGGAREMQIGDATLQIQTAPQTPDMVGAQQASNAQQYEKKVPAGQQSNSRNQGVEKGKVIPKGL